MNKPAPVPCPTSSSPSLPQPSSAIKPDSSSATAPSTTSVSESASSPAPPARTSSNRFKSVAQKLVQEKRIQRKPSALFQAVLQSHQTFMPVQKTYMTWLDVEKKLEEEYRKIQESSWSVMMKRTVVTGDGERASHRMGVNPFSDNRVVLSRLPDEPPGTDSTFINASYLDGLVEKEYIAAAMPHNAVTRVDFWRMVFEQNVHIIVMLNDEHEQSCQAYWPVKVGETEKYGNMTVTHVETRRVCNSSDCLVRTFKFVGPDGKEREVFHCQYREWLDFGIPQEKDEFLSWFGEVDSMYEDWRGKMGPVVVHCFGGVGRTGTFLTVHITLQKMKRMGGQALEIEKILCLMRHKRANLVQTAEQYKFCYRVLLELYESKRSLVSVLSILKPKD